MKVIESPIYQHENGRYYFVKKKNGKPVVRCFGTDDLDEARRILRERGIASFFEKKTSGTKRQNFAVPVGAKEIGDGNQVGAESERKPRETFVPAPPQKPVEMQKTVLQALDEHDAQLLFRKKGTLNMIKTARKAILCHSSGWEKFSCATIWKNYREKGVRKKEREVGAATNHLLWYFRMFIPWAIEQGYLPKKQKKELKRLEKTSVNSRRVRVCHASSGGRI